MCCYLKSYRFGDFEIVNGVKEEDTILIKKLSSSYGNDVFKLTYGEAFDIFKTLANIHGSNQELSFEVRHHDSVIQVMDKVKNNIHDISIIKKSDIIMMTLYDEIVRDINNVLHRVLHYSGDF